MKLLAIEAATEACSVAVVTGESVIERHLHAPREHARLMLPMIDEVLAEAGLSKRALDAVAVGRGPGAFTGVRLAISIAQGLALGLDRPVVPVSTLAALALEADGDCIAAAIDARMGEVYFAWFERDDDGLVAPVSEEMIRPPEAVAQRGRIASFAAIGTGWSTYRAALATRLGEPAAIDPEALPRASNVARLALRDYAAGRYVDAAQALPVYLRDKVALTVDEQRAARAAKAR